jgi:hypothetical protein
MSSLVDSWGEKAHKVMKWKLYGHKSQQTNGMLGSCVRIRPFKGVQPSKCQQYVQYGYVWIIIGFSLSKYRYISKRNKISGLNLWLNIHHLSNHYKS